MAHSHARKLILTLLAAAFFLAAVLAYAAVSSTPSAHAATHHHKKHKHKKKKKKRCHPVYVKKCHKHHKCKRVKRGVKCKKNAAPAAQPKYGGALPGPSLFGLNTGTFGNNHAEWAADFQNAKNLGARWLHYTGGSIHFYSNGQPNYSTMDWEVMQTRKLGMGVAMSLGGSPTACSSHPSDYETCPPRTSGELAAYRSYLTGLVLHYRNNVDTYESWVEPNHNSFWPSGPNPQEYANLLKTQWSVFQAVNQQYGLHLKLLYAGPSDFGINGPDAVLPFTEAVLNDLHGQKSFDAVALHAYRFPPAAPSAALWTKMANGQYAQHTWPEAIQLYEEEFANHGYGTPDLWFTEFGWPGDANARQDIANNCANSSDKNCPQYYPTEQQQQRNLEDAYADLLGGQMPYVKAAFWFNLRDYDPSVQSPDPDYFYHYGLAPFDYTPGGNSSLKPAGNAWTALAKANPTR